MLARIAAAAAAATAAMPRLVVPVPPYASESESESPEKIVRKPLVPLTPTPASQRIRRIPVPRPNKWPEDALVPVDWTNVASISAIKVRDVISLSLNTTLRFQVARVVQEPDEDRLKAENAEDARGIGGVWGGTFYGPLTSSGQNAVLKLTTRDEVDNHLKFEKAYPENVPKIYHWEAINGEEVDPKAAVLIVMEMIDATWLYDEKHVYALWELVDAMVNGEREIDWKNKRLLPMHTDLHGDNVMFRKDDGRPVMIDFDSRGCYAGVSFHEVGTKGDADFQSTLIKMVLHFFEEFFTRCIDARDLASGLQGIELLEMGAMGGVLKKILADAPPKSFDDGTRPLATARRWWFRGNTVRSTRSVGVDERLTVSRDALRQYLLALNTSKTRKVRVDASLLPFALTAYHDADSPMAKFDFSLAKSLLLPDKNGSPAPEMNARTRETLRRLHVTRLKERDEWVWYTALYVYCVERARKASTPDTSGSKIDYDGWFWTIRYGVPAFSAAAEMPEGVWLDCVPALAACVDAMVEMTVKGDWPGDASGKRVATEENPAEIKKMKAAFKFSRHLHWLQKKHAKA